MPVVNITLASEQITTEQKREMIQRVTKTLVDITNIPEASFTTIIQEYPLENLGNGTVTLQDKFSQMTAK